MHEDTGRSLSTYFLIAACRELWFLTRAARRVTAGQPFTSPLGGGCLLAGGGLGGGGAVGDLARVLVFGMATGLGLFSAPGAVRWRGQEAGDRGREQARAGRQLDVPAVVDVQRR